MKTYTTVDEYMNHVPHEFTAQLIEMRTLIKKLIPHGKEGIAYGMPTITIDGKNFIHFACMKGHLGFYPTPSGVTAFIDDIKKQGISYSKGCIRFSYTKPLPAELIKKIIIFRLQEE